MQNKMSGKRKIVSLCKGEEPAPVSHLIKVLSGRGAATGGISNELAEKATGKPFGAWEKRFARNGEHIPLLKKLGANGWDNVLQGLEGVSAELARNCGQKVRETSSYYNSAWYYVNTSDRKKCQIKEARAAEQSNSGRQTQKKPEIERLSEPLS